MQEDLYTRFDKDPAPIAGFIRWLAASYELQEPLAVLDIGCGPGRMLDEYDRFGWRVLGMEPDPDFLTMARERAKGLARARVEQGGFGDLRQGESFDLISAVNGPFAYLLTPQEQVEAIGRLFRALRPGGVLFLDLPNLLWFLRNMPGEQWEGETVVDGHPARLICHYDYDLHDAIFTQTNEYVVTGDEGETRRIMESHKHAIISYPALAYQLEGAGFRELRTYKEYGAREIGRLTGKRMMVSARRPGDEGVENRE